MSIYIYPRLPRDVAHRIIAELADKGLTELVGYGALSHPSAAPAAVGGIPVPQQELQRIQVGLREIASGFGFPSKLDQRSQQNLDRTLGTYLYKELGIVPGDAAVEGVWSFLTLVLVPELSPWRFPQRAESRLIGVPRNALRRLWWRAWALGPDLNAAPGGCSPLGEDEFVQIMERSGLSGSRKAARAARDAVWRAEANGLLPILRTELMRGLIPRVLAARSHVVLDILSDDELAALLDGYVRQILERPRL
ncbi:hypothetical protein LJ756_14875 [Arthrobacter sp. zg-Y411]|uniref:hypothetical protein n=1 Tax=Arthrobacter zhangbolii TaxID=2886936 RepID=UPI001D13EF89|nr:hypothetical protein [Arthrobacter zhangbolii]MCC3295902.1 hypothetical protein [Arthrobacter zhangbolii]